MAEPGKLESEDAGARRLRVRVRFYELGSAGTDPVPIDTELDDILISTDGTVAELTAVLQSLDLLPAQFEDDSSAKSALSSSSKCEVQVRLTEDIGAPPVDRNTVIPPEASHVFIDVRDKTAGMENSPSPVEAAAAPSAAPSANHVYPSPLCLTAADQTDNNIIRSSSDASPPTASPLMAPSSNSTTDMLTLLTNAPRSFPPTTAASTAERSTSNSNSTGIVGADPQNTAGGPQVNPFLPGFNFAPFGGLTNSSSGSMFPFASLFDMNALSRATAANSGAGGGNIGAFGDVANFAANGDMLNQLMESPVMRSLMNSPDLLKSLIDSNPQMRELREQNPELNHLLNDPELLQQSIQAMRNPSLMREIINNTDRALSNIDAVPGGFNALRRVYHTLQEPIWDATVSMSRDRRGTAKKPLYSLDITTDEPKEDVIPNPFATSSAGGSSAAAASAGSVAAGTSSAIANSGFSHIPPNFTSGNSSWQPALRAMMEGLQSSHTNSLVSTNSASSAPVSSSGSAAATAIPEGPVHATDLVHSTTPVAPDVETRAISASGVVETPSQPEEVGTASAEKVSEQEHQTSNQTPQDINLPQNVGLPDISDSNAAISAAGTLSGDPDNSGTPSPEQSSEITPAGTEPVGTAESFCDCPDEFAESSISKAAFNESPYHTSAPTRLPAVETDECNKRREIALEDDFHTADGSSRSDFTDPASVIRGVDRTTHHPFPGISTPSSTIRQALYTSFFPGLRMANLAARTAAEGVDTAQAPATDTSSEFSTSHSIDKNNENP